MSDLILSFRLFFKWIVKQQRSRLKHDPYSTNDYNQS